MAIASRYGVTVAELRKWNMRKIGNSDLIKVGDTLVVMLPRELAPPEPGEAFTALYDVRSGDTLGGIAHKLGVTVADLRHWNRIKPDGVIRIGQHLRYRKIGKRPAARSHGTPTRGRLIYGVHLGDGPGYRLRFPKNAHTTQPVRTTLQRCTKRMKSRFKGTADILIGDISRPMGGHFPPHVSHQSGRDADVGYYIAGNVQNNTMYRVRPHDVDYKKTWALLRCFLIEDEVVRVFVDTKLQHAMVKYLRKQSVDEDTLDRLFEVIGPTKDKALIRHAPNHDTHLHVRFACEPGDEACEEDPGETVFRF